LRTLFLIPIAVVSYVFSGLAIAQTSISYTSPIADYKTFVDEKVTSWKAANDKVGQIGGWRAYAKEAQQPDNTPAPSPNAAPMQKPVGMNTDEMKKDPHAGHKP
jgi:hypothetical protein